MSEAKPHWPADAIIVVAANRGEEIKSQMEASVFVSCRLCGQVLATDTATIRKAKCLPERHGRPIDFFCIPCCCLHDRNSIDVLQDHRPKVQR